MEQSNLNIELHHTCIEYRLNNYMTRILVHSFKPIETRQGKILG